MNKGRPAATAALLVNAFVLAGAAYRNPDLRAFLAGLSVASIVLGVLVWTSDRWLVARRRQGGVTAALADVFAAPVLAIALLVVLVLIVALAFAWVGARMWH